MYAQKKKEQIGSDTLENILFVDDFDANVLCPIQLSGNFVRMPTTPGHSILGGVNGSKCKGGGRLFEVEGL